MNGKARNNGRGTDGSLCPPFGFRDLESTAKGREVETKSIAPALSLRGVPDMQCDGSVVDGEGSIDVGLEETTLTLKETTS